MEQNPMHLSSRVILDLEQISSRVILLPMHLSSRVKYEQVDGTGTIHMPSQIPDGTGLDEGPRIKRAAIRVILLPMHLSSQVKYEQVDGTGTIHMPSQIPDDEGPSITSSAISIKATIPTEIATVRQAVITITAIIPTEIANVHQAVLSTKATILTEIASVHQAVITNMAAIDTQAVTARPVAAKPKLIFEAVLAAPDLHGGEEETWALDGDLNL